MRTGTVTTTQTSFVAGDSGYIDFTFDTPMPDTDYVVEWVSDTSELSTTTAFTKTVNGGRLYFTVVGAVDHAISLTYKAFKLYTDTEYNGLIEDVAEIKSDLSGKRIVTGDFSISVTANETKSVASSSDIVSGTLPPDLYHTSYTFGGFSNSIPNNISFCVDSNALKVRMDATNSSVGVNWICVY